MRSHKTNNNRISTTFITGAQAVIETLINEGIDVVFGYPGGAIMPVYDALYDKTEQLKHYLPRHEQGAIHAAEAYAKISGKPGVVFATSGPGATNLMTGLANATMDSTPLVCITGQVSSSLLGYDAFQETDVVGISMPVTKWNYQITKPEEVPYIISKAFYIASTGRPGPVLIDITKDAQTGLFKYKYEKVEKVSAYYPYPKINSYHVRQAAKLINQSQRPLIFAGQGVRLSRANKLLTEFSEKTGIPVAVTLWGLTSFPNGHPNFAGMLGMHGNYATNKLTDKADLIMAIGMRFDDRVTGKTKEFATNARIIHIDIDPSEVNKIIKSDVSITGDARMVLDMLLPLVNKGNHQRWLSEFSMLAETEYSKVIQEDIHPTVKGIRMAEVINMVSEKTKGKAIIIADVGQHQMMTARYYKFTENTDFVTSGGLGTMGFGLPAAFGASVANPDKTVILFVGDGGFQMTIQELATIVKNNANIKIIMLNNSFLGMVRQWQQLFNQKRYSFTPMDNPDFVKIAYAYGLRAVRVDSRKNLANSIDDLLDFKGPAFLEVIIEHEDNVFPMVPPGEKTSNMLLSVNNQN